MTLRFDRDGAELCREPVKVADYLAILPNIPDCQAGMRLRSVDGLPNLIGMGSFPWGIASNIIGAKARPVRAILFDKNPTANWSLDWHQDRTIAVQQKKDVAGFGNWSLKQGIPHVEPPFDLLADMVTIRIHLDHVDQDNAPLRIAPGSHRLGRLTEDKYSSVLRRCGEKECLAKAGEVWFYSTPILHASSASNTPGGRRVLQVDYSADELPEGLQWAGL